MTVVFSQTSDAPYGRHTYEVVLKNHKKVFFETWEEVQVYWFTHNQIPDFLDVVNVKDKKTKTSGGFGK